MGIFGFPDDPVVFSRLRVWSVFLKLISTVGPRPRKGGLLLRRRTVLIAVPILLIAAVLLFPAMTHRVYAAGTVCLNDPSSFSTSAPCPPTPPALQTALNAPAPDAAATYPAGSVHGPQQIRVGVYISGPDQINGYDITLITNRTVLRPTAIDLTGTILAPPTNIVVECIDSSLVTGITCLSTDVTGTIHLSMSGAPGALSSQTTGLLFTAIYNVTGRTPARGQLIQFQTGCAGATSDPPICVTITNGGTSAVPESVASIGFNNSVDPHWVGISSTTPTVTFLTGTPSPLAKINATAENGWPGIVGTDSVSFADIVIPPGLTVSFTGAVTSCSTGGATCGVSVSFAGSAGVYSVTFIGNYIYSNDTTLSNDGTLAGTVVVQVVVQDFSISSISPSPVVFVGGQTAKAEVTLAGSNGFSGSVTLSSSITPTGLNATFNPTVVQISRTSPNSNVTFASLKGGVYTVHISATSQGITRMSSLTVKVQDFSLTASATNLAALVGTNATSTITMLGLNGFSGTVNISVSASAGLTATPTTKTITGTFGTFTLTLKGSQAGNYVANVTGVDGALSHTVTVHLNVTDFTIGANPSTIGPANVGVGVNSTITITAVNGFTGTVNLSPISPSGLTVTFTPSSITGSGTSIMTVKGSSAGTFTITVKGSIGSLSHTVDVTVKIADFQISANPSVQIVNQGDSGTFTVTVSSFNGFTANVTLGAVTPTGWTATFAPRSFLGSGTSTLTIGTASIIVEGNYTVTITGTSPYTSHPVTVTVRVASFISSLYPVQLTVAIGSSDSSSILTVQSENGFHGTVALTVQTVSGVTFSPAPASFTVGPGADGSSTLTISVGRTVLPGVYLLNLTVTGGTINSELQIPLTVPVPDFSVSADTHSVTVVAGVQGKSTISVAFFNGFNGTVTLAPVATSGFVCTIDHTSISPGGSITSGTLSCSGTAAGKYNVTITGSGSWTDGNIVVRRTLVEFSNQDFIVSLAATSIVANVGSPAHVTITIAAIGSAGWTGTVTITTSASAGLTATLSTSTLTGTGTVTLNVTPSDAVAYTVTITVASGSLSHTQTLTVTGTGVQQASNFFSSPLFYGVIGVVVVAILGGTVFALTRRGKPGKTRSK